MRLQTFARGVRIFRNLAHNAALVAEITERAHKRRSAIIDELLEGALTA